VAFASLGTFWPAERTLRLPNCSFVKAEIDGPAGHVTKNFETLLV